MAAADQANTTFLKISSSPGALHTGIREFLRLCCGQTLLHYYIWNYTDFATLMCHFGLDCAKVNHHGGNEMVQLMFWLP